jgi:hypothetical protein
MFNYNINYNIKLRSINCRRFMQTILMSMVIAFGRVSTEAPLYQRKLINKVTEGKLIMKPIRC